MLTINTVHSEQGKAAESSQSRDTYTGVVALCPDDWARHAALRTFVSSPTGIVTERVWALRTT